MIKKTFKKLTVYIPQIFIIVICLWGFIFHPEKIGNGVSKGLILTAQKIIPSLFPFMVFASCLSKTYFFHLLSVKLEKVTRKIFRISGIGFSAVLLGFLGGYPVGAKAVADAYKQELISEDEAGRLFIWCANPSPAFVISAVGVFMFSSYRCGIILYVSSLMSALVMGFFTRFFADTKTETPKAPSFSPARNIFVNSVSETGETLLGICGWLLTSCAISALSELLIRKKGVLTFINCITEVTSACEIASDISLPLPVVSAILGFGGFAVILQILTYMKTCKVPVRIFICTKILNGALSAFFCSVLLKIFPQSAPVYATITYSDHVLPISHNILTAVILLIMCLVFVLEVDNKRKLC